MILKTNTKSEFIVGVSNIKNGFVIENHTNLNTDLISNLFNKVENGTVIKFFYEKNINNFKIFIKDNNINICGPSDDELLLGVYYLYSIINSQAIIRNQVISDYSKYRHREFSLDVARNYFSVNEIKKIINELAFNRINYFHLHLSDDQNFSIKSDAYPLLNIKNQYTKSEIRDLVKYANERGVEIIPEIDMPGHFTHILNAYPVLKCNNYIKGNVMCLKKQNYAFIYNLIDEMVELFPGKYFHIGCDELDLSSNNKCDCYKNNKKAVEEFVNSISLYLLNKGKTPIVWNDALQYGDLNEEIVVQKWIDYSKDKKSIKEYKNGRNFIIGSTTDTYFDYPFSLIPLKKTYNYIPNIQGKEVENILGISSHVWCEHINQDDSLELHIFPRIQAFAENAWVKDLNYSDFKNRMAIEIENLKRKGINCSALVQADNVDYNEIVDYLLLKTKMQLYAKPDYLETINLTLKLLKNTQTKTEIVRDLIYIGARTLKK